MIMKARIKVLAC